MICDQDKSTLPDVLRMINSRRLLFAVYRCGNLDATLTTVWLFAAYKVKAIRESNNAGNIRVLSQL
jgi:hypothetical protein